jgi:hemerythrin superfamily protein
MNKTATPIKRHKDLFRISHEHHHSLVFCSRLKHSEAADAHTLQRFVLEFWNLHLREHCHNEEECILPYIADTPMANRMLDDHLKHTNLIHAIQIDTLKAHKYAALLYKSLREHISFEEHELLPYVEKVCTPTQLASIGALLDHTEIASHNFEPKFWKNHENKQ